MQDIRGHHARRLSMFAAGLSDEAIDQKRNIVFAVTQRRQVERQNSQAVVEILPELLGLDQFGQIFVCGRNDSCIDLDRLIASDALDFTFLENPQQLRLEGRSRVGNLIEKNRPAVRLFEQPSLVDHGSGKGPFHMPEQFTLKECFR